MDWLIFVVTGCLGAGTVRLAREIGVRRALLDRPNERSSHTAPVPRLGGAALVPVLVGAVLALWRPANSGGSLAVFVATVGSLFAIGLLDDVRSVSPLARLAVQTAVAGAMVAATYRHWVPDGLPIVRLLVVAGVGTGLIGILNIYNFMDGIDGLAGLQAVIAGLAWAVIGSMIGVEGPKVIGIATAAAAAGFLTLNWPPAKIFMGDAGSTVLGFTFAVLPLLTVVEMAEVPSRASGASMPTPAALLGTSLLVIFPIAADGCFTLCRRLLRGENVFAAHRGHIYQRLVVAGLTHRTVTLLYGALALLGAVAGVALIRHQALLAAAVGAASVTSFWALWRWVTARERQGAAKTQKQKN